MYAGISAAFLPSLRAGHTSYGHLEAWHNGTRLTVDDGMGNQVSQLPLEERGPNEIPVDAATPGSRRICNATLTAVPGLWDALAPVGTELRAFVTIRYPSGVTETVPQGVFPIDVQKMSYGPGGTLTLTAPDRWSRIVNATFLTPRQVGGGGVTARTVIATLLLEALPAGSAVTDIATSTATVPKQTEDSDRAGLIQKIAKAASIDVSFDRSGNPVIRDVPVLNPASPAWTVDSGDGGVLVAADRSRDRQKTYNLIVLNGQTTDGSSPFATQYVWDNDVNSPTYCGPGTGSGPTPPAASSAGPFGQRPYRYTSPLLTNTGQAIAAGQTILARVTALNAQLTLTSLPCAALDDGDTILVKLPPERRDLTRPEEVHLVDGFTVQLVPSANDMPIITRSTRPDDTSGV